MKDGARGKEGVGQLEVEEDKTLEIVSHLLSL